MSSCDETIARRARRRPLAMAIAALAIGLAAQASGESAETRVGLIDAMRERILAHLELRPGQVVAEIGMGPGWFAFRAAEAVGPDGVVYATDIDPAAIAKVREKLGDLGDGAGRIVLRHCRNARDTGLDDLSVASVDVILMVDSLCFDAGETREHNLAYLRRLLRILRPGGRHVHHKDCRCEVSAADVIALFTAAGFAPRVATLDVSPDPAAIEPDWPCRSEAQRRRHAFVAIFHKAVAQQR